MSADADAADPTATAGVNYLELSFALMGGATVWLIRLVVNSALVVYSCGIGATWPLWLTSGVTTLIAAAALWSAWRFWRGPAEGGDRTSSAPWLGLLGVMFNVTAIAGIVLETLPVAVLDVCSSTVTG